MIKPEDIETARGYFEGRARRELRGDSEASIQRYLRRHEEAPTKYKIYSVESAWQSFLEIFLLGLDHERK